MLCVNSLFNMDFEDSKGFAQSCWTLRAKRSTQVLEVALAHILEHFDLLALYDLADVFVIVGFKESRLTLSTRIIFPQVWPEDRVQEIIVWAAVHLSECLKLNWEVYFYREFHLVMVEVIDLIVCLLYAKLFLQISTCTSSNHDAFSASVAHHRWIVV